MHHVVGVHARNEGRAAVPEPGGEGRHQPLVGALDQPDAEVVARGTPGDPAAGVARAVVDEHALPVPEGLAPQALETRVESRFGVEDRQQHRNAGQGHEAGL